MNKYLMLTAAALAATTLPVLAGTLSKDYRISFDGSCDGMEFYKSNYPGVGIELGKHLLEKCSAADTEVAGQVHKTDVSLVEDWIPDSQGLSYLYDISKPIQNGGAWTAYYCTSGMSCTQIASGTYTLGYGPGKSHGLPPSTPLSVKSQK